MKIQKSELANKINKIKSVVPKKASQNAIQGVLLKDGYLIASNTELSIKAKIENTLGETFIIPEKAFDLINNLPDGEVDISVTGKNNIIIKADKIKNKYQTIDPNQFPVTTAPEDGSELTIEADMLLKSINRVSYAVPAQANNAKMSSLCLQAGGGQLNFVGLDGHMIAWDRIDYDGEFELLIPKNTMDKLRTLGLSGSVQIKHSRIGASFITEEFELYTRLVEGTYFRYQTMFSQLPLHTIIARTDLLNAMTRAKMCTEERCPVRFELIGDSLNLSIKDKTTDYQEIVDLQENIEEPLTIGFNARLVLETLKAFDCENVRVFFEGSKTPMIVEDMNSNLKSMVLPVKL